MDYVPKAIPTPVTSGIRLFGISLDRSSQCPKLETGEILPLAFHHQALVPAENTYGLLLVDGK